MEQITPAGRCTAAGPDRTDANLAAAVVVAQREIDLR